MTLARAGSLQVAEDFRFQRRAWVVERVGWVLLALVIVATLAGALGGGPVSSLEVRSREGLFSLRYDRFAHREAAARLTVSYGAAAVEGGELRLAVEAAYLRQQKVEHVEPRPQRVELAGEQVVYVFAARPAAGMVTFELQFQDFGPARGRLAIGGDEARVAQFVYP